MKKQNQIALPFILIASLFIFSCSNKETPDPAPKTKTQLLLQGSWSFDKALSGTFDISSQVPACYKDNVVTFGNSTGSVSNPLPCTPTDNTPSTFTWNWLSNETVLSLNAPLFPGGTGNFNLVSLTETALVVSQDVNFGTGTINVIFYYKH